MIANVFLIRNFMPFSIWFNYSNLFYIEIDSFTLANDLLAEMNDLFESATFDSND